MSEHISVEMLSVVQAHGPTNTKEFLSIDNGSIPIGDASDMSCFKDWSGGREMADLEFACLCSISHVTNSLPATTAEERINDGTNIRMIGMDQKYL